MPPAVHREIESLAGKSAGYANARRLLGADPCQGELGAYRLSGPLAPVVCGARLKNGYRLAFTTQPPMVPADDGRTRVVVLYVGKREAGHRTQSDVWDVIHDLFGVDNPPSGHHKPPCCASDVPAIGDKELESFLMALRQLQRGR